MKELEDESRRLIAHGGLEWSADCLRFQEKHFRGCNAQRDASAATIYRSALGRKLPFELAGADVDTNYLTGATVKRLPARIGIRKPSI